jgi:hypothetical protein
MVLIERTTESGYLEKEYSTSEAVQILNQELDNERTIWIDSRPHNGDIITAEDIDACKKSICVTNKLIGG